MNITLGEKEKKIDALTLKSGLGEMPLKTRAANCLKKGVDWQFKCVGDLIEATDQELLRIPDCGRATLKEIRYITDKVQRKRNVALIASDHRIDKYGF